MAGVDPGSILTVHAYGPDDPNGVRTAAILNAHFDAEFAQTFCRLLWRRSAFVILLALVLEGAGIIPRTALVAAVLLFGALGAGAGVAAWRSQSKVNSLVNSQSTSG